MKRTWTQHYCIKCGKRLGYDGITPRHPRCQKCAAQRRVNMKPWTLPSGFQKGNKYGKRFKRMPSRLKKIPDRTSVHLADWRYNHWRRKVYKRDSYQCQYKSCGYTGKKLEAHHIKPWAEYPKLRYLVKNGITYCQKHHDKTHGRRPRK